MRHSPLLIAAIFVLVICPGGAEAHGTFAGAGGFYAGLMHPLVVPAELLALVSVSLLLGQRGRQAVAVGVPALGVGVSTGLLAAHFFAVLPALPTTLALVAAGVIAVLVVLDARLPPALSTSLALAAGFAVGVDAVPDQQGLMPILAACLATVIACVATVLVVAAVIADRRQSWMAIAVRVAASWIAASAILYIGWALSRT